MTGKNENAGKDAARYLHADRTHLPGDVSLECLNLILAKDAGSLSATQRHHYFWLSSTDSQRSTVLLLATSGLSDDFL